MSFGSGGSSSDNSIELAKAEEARRAKLRADIDRLFGSAPDVTKTVYTPTGNMITRAVQIEPSTGAQVVDPSSGQPVVTENPPASYSSRGWSIEDGPPEDPQTIGTVIRGRTSIEDGNSDQPTYRWDSIPETVASTVTEADPVAAKARAAFEAEESDVSGRTRDYYTRQAARTYGDSVRNLRFSGARTGNLMSSIFSDTKNRLDEDNTIASTRVADAATNAVNNLRAARATAKANAFNLVNSGSGAEAVQSAAEGIKAAAATARAAQMNDIFSDLFRTAAIGKATYDSGARDNAALAMMNSRVNNYFNTPGSSGTVLNPRG